MTPDDQIERPLDRRLLLRGGAVLAGAAGATVIGAVVGPSAANAADGGSVLIGRSNAATASTTLTSAPGGNPTLSLTNTNGPALRLNSLSQDWNGVLAAGDIAGTDFGPLVGVDYGGGTGPETSYLLTANDLAFIPLASALAVPRRLLDTRPTSRRGNIVQKSSTTAIDSSGRLTANSWIDVYVDDATAEFEMSAAFVNVTVIDPVANGYLTVYPPGNRPGVSTVNFRQSVALSNGAFVATGVYTTSYVVRVHSSQTTHVLLDLSGAILATASSAPAAAAASANMKQRSVRQGKRAAVMKARLQRSVS